MFKLRQDHLDAFSQMAMEDFLLRAAAHLRLEFASQSASASDQDLCDWTHSCIARAASFGLTSQFEVMCFVDTTFLLDAHFDEDPKYLWTVELLKDTDIPAAERAEILLRLARRRR